MDGKMAGYIGMVAGGVGILTAGLFPDRYTHVLLICGTVLAAAGILAVAISGISGKQ